MSLFHCLLGQAGKQLRIISSSWGSMEMLSVRQKETPQTGFWRLIPSLCSVVLHLLRVMARENWQGWHIWPKVERSVAHMCLEPLNTIFWLYLNSDGHQCCFLQAWYPFPVSVTPCMVHTSGVTWMEVSLQPSGDSSYPTPCLQQWECCSNTAKSAAEDCCYCVLPDHSGMFKCSPKAICQAWEGKNPTKWTHWLINR